MKTGELKSEKGSVLLAVVVIVLIFTLLGLSVLSVANSEILQARKAISKTKAFYLAEAGVARLTANLNSGNFASIGETALGCGTYRVDFNAVMGEPCAVTTGVAEGEARRVQMTMSFLIPPYECGIYAGGMDGNAWTFMLRGSGDPCAVKDFWGNVVGDCNGRDIINGNIFADGNVSLYQQASVNHAPWPNSHDLNGDVNVTGTVTLHDSATVSGEKFEHSTDMGTPDLVGMNYAVNNTHNVSQIFASAGVTHGAPPAGNPLRDVFQINPSDMTAECATTDGNDYFLTPSTGFIGGDWKTAPTPINVGTDRIYYVDGDVWVNSKSTYGFTLNGKVTIVATGNIHICDNTVYANTNSILGLVALGKYNSSGQRISGGDIIFGDPDYGTLYNFSGMMFAAHDFLYNSRAIGAFSAEPSSGFILNGSLAALNKVSIERDWYTRSGSERRPARYNPSTGQWYDSGTGVLLTSAQVDTMKHYRMLLNYDDRVRSASTQPPGLPKGTGLIFCGLTNWKELPSN